MTLEACRMCLAVDARMYSIANTPLQEIYEKMTNLKLQNEVGKPILACYICRYLLLKTQMFINRSIKADQMLMKILSSGLEISKHSISMTDRTHLHYLLQMTTFDSIPQELDVKPIEVPIKMETIQVKKEIEVEVPIVEDTIEDPPLTETRDYSSSESEDNLPLQAISSKNGLKKRSVKTSKEKVKKTQHSKDLLKIKPDVREVILTKEQQLEQLAARAKSLNFINSPYKCTLCYKGFVDARAFQNHNEKHDERSGQFECDICHMRYKSERHLRTHKATSHQRHYVCNKCDQLSHTANQAREHEKWHNGHTYECQLCSQTFSKPTSYLTHMRKRHPTEHVCNVCGESFVGRHGLLMHKSKAHWRDDEKNVDEQDTKSSSYCSECNIRFLTADAWKRHILTSLKHALGKEKSSMCLICGVSAGSTGLRTHVRSQHSQKTTAPAPPAVHTQQLPCEQCGQSFVTRSKLQAHVRRIHLGLKYNKNIVCEVCGKKCTSNASLTYHQRTHTGEKPFSCPSCPKRFADRNQLRIHSRTHSGERPYSCSVCPKTFSQKPALNRHYRVHTGAKPYACQFCSKTFTQSNSMKLHVSAIHLKLPQNKKKPPPATTETPQDL